jgi:hypothetical protein
MLAGFTILVAMMLMAECSLHQHDRHSIPSSGKLVDGLALIEKVVGRIEGRILSSLIHKGMTTEQVSDILSHDPMFLESGGQVGCVFFAYWRFYTYGVIVSFLSDDDAVLRVDYVDFFAFFE